MLAGGTCLPARSAEAARFDLPALAPSAPPGSAPAGPGSSPWRAPRWRRGEGTLRILVVDDEADIRDSLTQALHLSLDAEVLGVSNSEEAREVLESGRCDVVLLDYLLPDLEGSRLLPWMMERRILPRTIMITALPPETLPAPPLLLAGATAVFRKPLDFPALLETIRVVAPPGTVRPRRGGPG